MRSGHAPIADPSLGQANAVTRLKLCCNTTTEEMLFIAMRYVEGRDLRERLQRGRLDLGDAIGILGQVASALDAPSSLGHTGEYFVQRP